MQIAAGRSLLVRMDRIGDLVLSLPVDQDLFESSTWWISRGLGFVAAASQPPRQALELDRKISIAIWLQLYRRVRAQNFTSAVIFHAPWWVSALIWAARVPVRIGVKSQWHSLLFLNRAIRQKRSRAEHSELEYNYQLLEAGFHLAKGQLPRRSLILQADPAPLATLGLSAGQYCVVHPGMGGSALNWPIDNYAELVRRLSASMTVAITGTQTDLAFLEPLRALLGNCANVVWLDQKLKAHDLISVLAHARQIVAPSTGVLHLAASTGQPTLGIFSPVRVQHPRRWGPQGPRTTTLVPDVQCPGELSCLGPACEKFDCMKRITVDQVLSALEPAPMTDQPSGRP